MVATHAALHIAEIAEAEVPVAQLHICDSAILVGPAGRIRYVMIKHEVSAVPEAADLVILLLVALAAAVGLLTVQQLAAQSLHAVIVPDLTQRVLPEIANHP